MCADISFVSAHTLELNSVTIKAQALTSPDGAEVTAIEFNSDGQKWQIKQDIKIPSINVASFYLYGPSLPKHGVGPFTPVDSADWTDGIATFTGYTLNNLGVGIAKAARSAHANVAENSGDKKVEFHYTK
ncbi:hypothetical protein RQP46_005757 [Phenoliferia psychrophenolica]